MKHYLEILQSGTFKTVKVSFFNHAFMNAYLNNKEYVFKTDIEDICVGDAAVVFLNNNLKIVGITEVCNDDSLLDYNSDLEYRWLVSKIDLEAHLLRIKREKEIRKKLDDKIKTKNRTELIRELALSGNSDFLLKEFDIDVKIENECDQEEQQKDPIRFK